MYANSANLSVSPWDFQISFGETEADEFGGELVVNEFITIIMSPQHAKMFSKILSENVAKYEASVSEIKFNPKVLTESQDSSQ